ncbi:thermonuclease family protein [Oscillatoria salina]|uniref:thermonuclease family protein n=1 Tax=Oscillatoria salina TaxID=331517 RepID=UPI001CCAADD7|nr:thermonuclease family protein [Oscillatoria salina]
MDYLWTKISRKLIFGCLLLLAACQTLPSETTPTGLTAQVQRVVSGQTLEVVVTSQQPALIERVRLIGIKAPDLAQEPWGSDAKKQLESLVSEDRDTANPNLGSIIVESDVQEKDRFDRRLAYVWHQGKLLNEELVKQGYAIAIPSSPNIKYSERLRRAQEYARIMGLGIWNPEQPLRSLASE